MNTVKIKYQNNPYISLAVTGTVAATLEDQGKTVLATAYGLDRSKLKFSEAQTDTQGVVFYVGSVDAQNKAYSPELRFHFAAI